MAQTVIDNPILNSPFGQPGRYFRFSDDGITNEVVDGRRPSGYFLPVPPPKRKSKQLSLESEWTQERFRESEWINCRTVSRPFDRPETGKIAVKAINHFGDEVLKVYPL